MGVKVKVGGGENYPAILRNMFKKVRKARVGILEDSTYSGDLHKAGASVAQVALWHEYGTASGLPARAPFRTTLAEKREEWINQLKTLIKNNPQNPEAAVVAIGEIAAHDIQAKIESGQLRPGLRPETIIRKHNLGRSAQAATPLILTGEMMNAISSELADD